MIVNTVTKLITVVFTGLMIYFMTQINREVPSPYMDEIFHFPMTERYFAGNYTYWDNKITTFPGLYVVGNIYCRLISGISTVLGLAEANICTLPSLRWMNLIIFFATATVVYWIMKKANPENKPVKSYLWALQIMIIPTILCPYFLYYTDGLSLLLSVLSILFAFRSERGNRLSYVLWSAACTLLAVGVRQTNIILTVLNPAIIVLKRYGILHQNKKYPGLLSEIVRLFSMIFSEFSFILKIAIPFLSILILFMVFFVLNGYSIVVGDRSNHTISLHLMQCCYFAAFFCCVFVDDIVLKLYLSIKKHDWMDRKTVIRYVLFYFVACLFVFVCMERFFIVHPFIRSDNRHFVFYIFKDIILPFKYYLIPVFALCICIMINVVTSELSEITSFVLAILFGVVILSSPVVEFRYFTLPVVVYICLVKPRTHPIISLSASTLLNLCTAYLFLYRPFTWPDGSIARFMW